MTHRILGLNALSAGLLTALMGFATYPSMGQAAMPAGAGEQGLIKGERIPTGQWITPTATPGSTFHKLNPDLPGHPDYRVDHATSTAISPDGQTMLVLTSGYNRVNAPDGSRIDSASNEYVFVYDISQGQPRKTQVIQVPNTFVGIAWNPNPNKWGDTFYVSGGVDDEIHTYTLRGGQYEESGDPIVLGHANGNGLQTPPMAAGLSVSPNGDRLLVANLENDSVSLIDLANRNVVAEQDLRPGRINPAQQGVPGGEYPFDTAFDGAGKAYVSSERDREIDVLKVNAGAPYLQVMGRIATQGQPNKMVLNKDRTRLYVASDNSDRALVVNTQTDRIVQSIPTVAPEQVFPDKVGFKGAGPNDVRLSPDQRFLFVSNGGTNSVAVIHLAGAGLGPDVTPVKAAHDDDVVQTDTQSRVIGLIPTGWYPESVNVSPNGRRLFVLNGKNNAGPNIQHCTGTDQSVGQSCTNHNQYIWQLEKAGFLSLPLPNAIQLGHLTRQVAYNNHFLNAADYQKQRQTMQFLHDHIKHVIYVIKENRTYDQVLGDLPEGNGDPSLAFLGPYMPNHHRWASQFVDLDNFYDSAETSNVGWDWSTAARTNDYTEKSAPINYAGRGFTYDQEGTNRNINIAAPTLAERQQLNPLTPDDPDILPGTRDAAALDGPTGEDKTQEQTGQGYIWNQALKAGLSLRNYGFFGNLARYSLPQSNSAFVPLARHPYTAGARQFFPTKPVLMTHSDLYFRGFDNNYPDFWREAEWAREFEQYVANGNLPALSQVRLMHDHTGNFDTAIDGVNTVATQEADNDYATGKLIQRVAHSPYKNNTLIFVIEDDAQDGADHVDAHRSIGFVVGPYVKQHQVVSHYYNTVSMLRTIEDVLGIQPMGLNDELAQPMTDVFDLSQTDWTYNAVVPSVLRQTDLPLPQSGAQASTVSAQGRQARILSGCFAHSRRSAAYWARVMKGQNFKVQDHLDTSRYNHALWIGFKGKNTPYPDRNGRDMRNNRQVLLKAHRETLVKSCSSGQLASTSG